MQHLQKRVIAPRPQKDAVDNSNKRRKSDENQHDSSLVVVKIPRSTPVIRRNNATTTLSQESKKPLTFEQYSTYVRMQCANLLMTNSSNEISEGAVLTSNMLFQPQIVVFRFGMVVTFMTALSESFSKDELLFQAYLSLHALYHRRCKEARDNVRGDPRKTFVTQNQLSGLTLTRMSRQNFPQLGQDYIQMMWPNPFDNRDCTISSWFSLSGDTECQSWSSLKFAQAASDNLRKDVKQREITFVHADVNTYQEICAYCRSRIYGNASYVNCDLCRVAKYCGLACRSQDSIGHSACCSLVSTLYMKKLSERPCPLMNTIVVDKPTPIIV